MVPLDRICYDVGNWVILLEKALAKVLGEYRYVEELSRGEAFSEVTGIPCWNKNLTE